MVAGVIQQLHVPPLIVNLNHSFEDKNLNMANISLVSEFRHITGSAYMYLIIRQVGTKRNVVFGVIGAGP